ncbi:PCC domain-containing protein [Oryzobacter telluris]|uniref:PCC domain-containing protein n=1 Tax=Oryzobacter telluris TaxID=3149179 RepID=UPI00370D8965
MTVSSLLRPLAHPGPASPSRRTSIATRVVSEERHLPAGDRLIDAVDRVLHELGVSSAQVELLSGTFATIDFVHPALCHDGATAVTYSETKRAVGPVAVVGGGMTVGHRDGERFSHTHMAWLDADGDLRGGHLWPDVVIGVGGVRVHVHGLLDVELRSEIDTESRLPVFTPHACPHGDVARPTGRAVMSRLAPGVVLDDALGDLVRESGFAAARIDGSVGSLVGAVVDRSGSRTLVIDGPATEVALRGDLAPGASPRVHALVIDRFGSTFSGLLTPGANLVAVTLELLVREVR